MSDSPEDAAALDREAEDAPEGASEGDAGWAVGDEAPRGSHAGPEMREHRRVRAVKLVQYKRFDPDHLADRLVAELGLGKTLDVSEGGLNFVCSTPLPAAWGLHIDLAVANDEIITVEGRIIHVEEVGDHRYRVGVKFTNLTDSMRVKLAGLVAERSGRSERPA